MSISINLNLYKPHNFYKHLPQAPIYKLATQK